MAWTWLLLGMAALVSEQGRARGRLVRLVAADRLTASAAMPTQNRGGWSVSSFFSRSGRRPRGALLAAVRLLVAELDAGARPAAALDAARCVAGDYAGVFSRAADAVRAGVDAAPILRAEPALAFLGHAWTVAGSAGVALAEVLRRAATDCAAQDEQRRAVSSALAGARASTAVMAMLPLVGVALGAAMGADPLATLFGTSAGRVALAAGVMLEAAGLAWTALIARRALRPS